MTHRHNYSSFSVFPKHVCWISMTSLIHMFEISMYRSVYFFNFLSFFPSFFFFSFSLTLFFLASSPAQTTVPPGIATRQVSLYAISKISVIREICWAMCNNVGSQVLIFSALLTFSLSALLFFPACLLRSSPPSCHQVDVAPTMTWAALSSPHKWRSLKMWVNEKSHRRQEDLPVSLTVQSHHNIQS